MVHCPTCDAGLRFEIETQQMACDHCGNRFEVVQTSDGEQHDAKGHKLLDLYVFVCPDCGAELAVNDENDAVGFCPYCGGTSMLFNRVRQDWVPDGVIPFKVTKEQCKQAYVEHVRKYPFVSRKYRDPDLIDSFRGIYMPYWQFEGKQETPFKVEGVEVVDGSSSDKRIRRVFEQWYKPDYTITGLSHDASSSFDDHISEHLAPYHDEQVESFHPGYLSGFYAEISDMDQGEYEHYAQERCQDFTASKLPDGETGMTTSEKRAIETDITSLSNVMYPVWFMSYRRGNKISYAAVNGETGKVAADLPLSPLRIIGVSIVVALALFAAFSLIMGVLPSIKASGVLVLCALMSFVSLCVLNESCLGTLNQSLRLDGVQDGRRGEGASSSESSRGSTKSGIVPSLMARKHSAMVVAALLALIGIVLVVTDGSYSGSFRSYGTFMWIIGCIGLAFVAAGQVKFEIGSRGVLREGRTSQLENGIIETFLKYEIPFAVLNVVITVTSIVAMLMGAADNASKYLCYALCVVLAVEVLAYAASQIAFQTRIAERRPPQMQKEGAFYDTH